MAGLLDNINVGVNTQPIIETSNVQPASNPVAPTVQPFDTNAVARANSILEMARNKAPQVDIENKDYFPSEQGIKQYQGTISPIFTTGDILLPFVAADKIEANNRAKKIAEEEAKLKAQEAFKINQLTDVTKDPAYQNAFMTGIYQMKDEVAKYLHDNGQDESKAFLVLSQSKDAQDYIKTFNDASAIYNDVFAKSIDVLSNRDKYTQEAVEQATKVSQSIDNFIKNKDAKDLQEVINVGKYFQKYKTINETVSAISKLVKPQITSDIQKINSLSTEDYNMNADTKITGNFLTLKRDNDGFISAEIDDTKAKAFFEPQFNEVYKKLGLKIDGKDIKTEPEFKTAYEAFKQSLTNEVDATLQSENIFNYNAERAKQKAKNESEYTTLTGQQRSILIPDGSGGSKRQEVTIYDHDQKKAVDYATKFENPKEKVLNMETNLWEAAGTQNYKNISTFKKPNGEWWTIKSKIDYITDESGNQVVDYSKPAVLYMVPSTKTKGTIENSKEIIPNFNPSEKIVTVKGGKKVSKSEQIENKKPYNIVKKEYMTRYNLTEKDLTSNDLTWIRNNSK